jgi:uncharacterized membrane protein
MFPTVEGQVIALVQWLRLGVEALGAFVIAVGIVAALREMVDQLARRRAINFNLVRLSFARYLALALEFQLGADILSTAVSPSWDELGKLAVIAIIRTALNYFLTKEMSEETPKTEVEALAPTKA